MIYSFVVKYFAKKKKSVCVSDPMKYSNGCAVGCVPPCVRWIDGWWVDQGSKIFDDEGNRGGGRWEEGKRGGEGRTHTSLKGYLLLYLGVIRTSVKEESDTGE